MTLYHVVTDRPMEVGQKIVFDENNRSGVWRRAMEKLPAVEAIYANPDDHDAETLEHHTSVALRELALEEVRLAEHPELTAGEAIARSKEMMEGNRFRLFCLEFSFFGWGLLCMLTFGIGYLWLRPYERAAKAAFYREVSGTESRVENCYNERPELY